MTCFLAVKGVRFSFGNGSRSLIGASPNKPSLAIIVKNPTSDMEIKIFDFKARFALNV